MKFQQLDPHSYRLNDMLVDFDDISSDFTSLNPFSTCKSEHHDQEYSGKAELKLSKHNEMFLVLQGNVWIEKDNGNDLQRQNLKSKLADDSSDSDGNPKNWKVDRVTRVDDTDKNKKKRKVQTPSK